MKQINNLYKLILNRAEFYGINLNLRIKEMILTSFEADIDCVLGTSDWGYEDKISIDDFNNILSGFEELFESMREAMTNEN